jgi:circadian clock protein KaiC
MLDAVTVLSKSPTGIEGLDEIAYGGIPKGRATLVSGGAGSGKTVLGMEFLIHGILDYDEPGVFMAFEESEKDLAINVASFGYDLEKLKEEGKLAIDHVYLDRQEIIETGGYDLDGLFIRLGNAIDAIQAKRVVIDSLEVLFATFHNQIIIRSELLRLFRWIKDRGLTAIVTAERGDARLTRSGLEDFVADCVISLDHRTQDQISTRRLRIVKYRGSKHEMDEHPFLMGEGGVSVLPITSAGLNHAASDERVSSGVADLDKMLGGKGFFRGSSILVSGTAGCGKSSLAFAFLTAACQRGEPALYLGFEESPAQSIRNMKSIGIDLQPWVDKGLLQIKTLRASSLGLEAHLASIHQAVNEFQPKAIVLDPISVFMSVSDRDPVKSMLVRLVDFLKMRQITTFFSHLSNDPERMHYTEQRVSSIMDTWIQLRDMQTGGSRRVALSVLKSRGMEHSHEMLDFLLSNDGIHLGSNFLHR